MFNQCLNCKEYHADQIVKQQAEGAVAICPNCENVHPFLMQPLMIICGASAVGKTTTGQLLPQLLADLVVTMEGDILYSGQPIEPYSEMWLRVCKNIGQSGKPVLLSSNGMIPQNVEPRVERRYFSTIHYLAFTCEREEQVKRLKARPSWDNFGPMSKPQIDFNRWIREESGLELLDTTHLSVQDSAESVRQWVINCLDPMS